MSEREEFDPVALQYALIVRREAFSSGLDSAEIARRTIRKYLDTLGLDAKGVPYTRTTQKVDDRERMSRAINKLMRDKPNENEAFYNMGLIDAKQAILELPETL